MHFLKYLSVFPNSGLCQVQYVHLISTSLALPLSDSQSCTDIHEPTLPAHHHHNLPFHVLHHFIEEVPKQIHLINPTRFCCKEQYGDWQLALKCEIIFICCLHLGTDRSLTSSLPAKMNTVFCYASLIFMKGDIFFWWNLRYIIESKEAWYQLYVRWWSVLQLKKNN